jgi:YfiH family protein
MNDWIVPDWPAPPNVQALFTTRNGGFSIGPYHSLNLGDHVGDDPFAVAQNRALLRQYLPENPRWLNQVHGTQAIQADASDCSGPSPGDASFTRRPARVCAVLVADCLPILLCDGAGTLAGVIHAGWRGLAEGIIEQAVSAMGAGDTPLIAWLGPAIGPKHFEVGEEVRQVFIRRNKESSLAFVPKSHPDAGKWLGNLFLLAQQQLRNAGVNEIYGGGECTFSDPARFFSYRRDGNTGRMAGLIWLV